MNHLFPPMLNLIPDQDIPMQLTVPLIAGKTDDLESLSRDAHLWWRFTGEFLRILLAYAEFTDQQQESSMDFYYRYIVRSLGPAPINTSRLPVQSSRWRSFMTDDFSPIELSWSWGDAESIPTRRVRFSIEPIGPDAGSSKDPWNISTAYSLVHRLSDTFQGVDLQWFDHLSAKLTANCTVFENTSLTAPRPNHASPTSVFLAFELGDDEPLVKAYLLPPGRDAAPPNIICSTLEDFAAENSWQSLNHVVGFLKGHGRALGLQPFIIAVDCFDQSKQPRMKIYIRSQDTSFALARKILSLFEEDEGQISNGLEELKDLWKTVFCLENGFDHHKQLHSRAHETSGMLYYLEVRPGTSKVTARVYLPVKHYGGDDWNTTLGLVDFFKSRNRIQSRIADQYLNALRSVCNYRRLDADRGMHTYIAARIKNNSLDITSYLSPEAYHPNRHR